MCAATQLGEVSATTKEINYVKQNDIWVQDDNKEGAPYIIPDDSDHRVLLWDLTGGFRAPDPPGFERKPKLEIFADGRVVAGTNGPEFAVGEATLDKKQLKELLDFIVVEQKFFETSEADIRLAMQGYRSKMADGLTTMLNIDLEDQQQSVAVYTLSMAAREFKDYAPLQRLQAIEKKLRVVKLFADAGGQSGVDAILAAANASLKKQNKEAVPFSFADLVSVTQRADGSLTASLSRMVNNISHFATVTRPDKNGVMVAEVKIGR